MCLGAPFAKKWMKTMGCPTTFSRTCISTAFLGDLVSTLLWAPHMTALVLSLHFFHCRIQQDFARLCEPFPGLQRIAGSLEDLA